MNQEVEKKLKAQRKQEKQRIKQYGKIYSQALTKDQSNEYLQSMKISDSCREYVENEVRLNVA